MRDVPGMHDLRAELRLGLAPVLLLGWNMAAGNPLPFLAPCLLVTVLLTSAARPGLARLAGLLVLVTGLSWGLDRLFEVVGDSPVSVWLVLFAVASAAFARLARRPGDMVAVLTLISASIVVVVRHWAQGIGVGVPALLGGATAQAVVVALIAHALVPSRPGLAPARTPPRPTPGAEAVQVFGRGAALLALLGLALLLEDNSAVLVALTSVTILAAPAEAGARSQGGALLLANAAAAFLTLPLLVVASLRPEPVVLLLLALAAALWIAGGLHQGGARLIVARTGMPVFLVLLGTLLPKAGEALPALADRLLTLALVVLCAIAAVVLLRGAARRDLQIIDEPERLQSAPDIREEVGASLPGSSLPGSSPRG